MRIYLDEADEAVLNNLAGGTPLSEAQILTVIASAGLRVIGAHGSKFSVPLHFNLADEESPPVRAPLPKRKAA